MSAELDALWRLHDLDERVAEIRTRLEKFPAQRAALMKRADDEKARLEAHGRAQAEVLAARRKLEQEIEAVTATQRKFESQQPSVKTNAEYQALLQEINGCKGKRSDLETQVLMRFEDEERLGAEKPALERALKQAVAERDQQVAEIDRAEGVERAKLEALDAERAASLATLAAGTRQRYERVLGSRDGRAVVPILKGACGGCFRNQPPQLLQEAKRRDRLLICEGCGRLLVVPPEGAAV